jgi:hypothetical protein
VISGQITFPSGIEKAPEEKGNSKSASSAVMHSDGCKKIYCLLSPEIASSPQHTFDGSVRFRVSAQDIYVLDLDCVYVKLRNLIRKLFRRQIMNTENG